MAMGMTRKQASFLRGALGMAKKFAPAASGPAGGRLYSKHLGGNIATQGVMKTVKDYAKGQQVNVKVLDVDVEKERISLGIKQLSEDPFAGAVENVKKGEVVTVTVSSVQEAGIEVKLADGGVGFIRKTDLSRERSEQRPDRFAVGEKVDAKITNLDKKTRRIALSIKAKEMDEDKQAVAEFGSTESGASLGDILGRALAERDAKARKKKSKDEVRDEEDAE